MEILMGTQNAKNKKKQGTESDETLKWYSTAKTTTTPTNNLIEGSKCEGNVRAKSEKGNNLLEIEIGLEFRHSH